MNFTENLLYRFTQKLSLFGWIRIGGLCYFHYENKTSKKKTFKNYYFAWPLAWREREWKKRIWIEMGKIRCTAAVSDSLIGVFRSSASVFFIFQQECWSVRMYILAIFPMSRCSDPCVRVCVYVCICVCFQNIISISYCAPQWCVLDTHQNMV